MGTTTSPITLFVGSGLESFVHTASQSSQKAQVFIYDLIEAWFKLSDGSPVGDINTFYALCTVLANGYRSGRPTPLLVHRGRFPIPGNGFLAVYAAIPINLMYPPTDEICRQALLVCIEDSLPNIQELCNTLTFAPGVQTAPIDAEFWNKWCRPNF